MSSSSLSTVGVAGMGVMGKNLAMNIADHGFPVSVFNRTTSKMTEACEDAVAQGIPDHLFRGFETVDAFVQSLERPRRVILMLQAGSAVDAFSEQIAPLLEEGDIIIDAGNEWYENTERRLAHFEKQGIRWFGMGVSGGEEGARYGPSIMPGGDMESYEYIRPVVERIAAQVEDGPCVTYIGPGASGNYVKMVHNGIEYGDMQLLSEAYDILRRVGKLSNQELADVFSEWNNGELSSFLVEITSKILRKKDDSGKDGYLLDYVLDAAGSKGTGMWTVEEGARNGVPIPTVAAALDARYTSSFKSMREEAAGVLKGPAPESPLEEGTGDIFRASKQELIHDVGEALYASKVCSYAQGMHLLQVVSNQHQWNLNLGNIARIWKGGCIIRAAFLDRIKDAFDRDSKIPNLLFDEKFSAELERCQGAWRRTVSRCVFSGVPAPALSASLAYYDAIRSARLPANLLQAQRDFFGAHTYRRVDVDGVFHSDWNSANQE